MAPGRRADRADRTAAGLAWPGVTVHVSTCGGRFTTGRPLPDDHDPFPSIEPPYGAPVRTQARVITVDKAGSASEYLLFNAGIAEPDRKRLSRLVALGV